MHICSQIPSVPIEEKSDFLAKCTDAQENDLGRHVRFSAVTVREYSIMPSDTPAVSSGAGIEVRICV